MKNPNIISLALLFTFLVTATSSAQEKRLKFNDNHKFKIVQLTDIHWKYGNPDSDIAATRINEILDAEEPDLVVVTGDIVFAKPAAEGIKAALEPITKRNIPFAVTFGNHDDEQDLSRKELLDMRVGTTRVFNLTEKSKLQSAASTLTQLKNLGLGEWSHGKDIKNIAISVKRIK
jgi:predicted MPP superfamily phosphohydrolase